METIMNTASSFKFTAEQKEQIIAKAMEFLPKYEFKSGHHYAPTREGLSEIIRVHQKNKGWLYDLFMKHPNYNGKGQIVLTEQYNRKTDHGLIAEFGRFIYDIMYRWNNSIENKASHNFEVGEKVTIKNASGICKLWYQGMNKYVGEQHTITEDWGDSYLLDTEEKILFDDSCFMEVKGEKEDTREPYTRLQMDFFRYLGQEERAIQFADEYLVNLINEAFPWVKAHLNQKVSRIVNRICKKYGFDKEEGFNRKYTQFADAINPLKVTRYTIISINIFDFWTMSFGKDWQSCHTIDKTNLRRGAGTGYSGCYSAGTESYMLDGASFVVYIIDKDYDGDEFEFQDKLSRQMFHIGEDKLIQGRLYPQDNDTGSADTYKQIREIVQRVIAECYEVDNLWKNVRGTSECESVTYSEGRHYRDYEEFENCNVSYLRREGCELNKNRITIGHETICPQCGEWHDDTSERIVCDDCAEALICEECGAVINREYGYIETEEGFIFCDPCCAERAGYVYCNNDEHWHRESNSYVFRDNYDDCYYYDYWNERIETEDGNEYWTAENAQEDGYTQTYDGEWYPSDEVYYCEECHEYVHESDWDTEKEMCDDCAAKNITVGTKIRVVNDGKIYPSYKEWLEENGAEEYLDRFHMDEAPSKGDHGEIIAKGFHPTSGKKMYGILVGENVYVIGYDGVEREVA